MKKKKVIALVAHDNRKPDMVEWADFNWKDLSSHDLVCTGTTGSMVEQVIINKCQENDIVPPFMLKLKSGPLGGDQQLGAMISEGKVDMLIFFWDPMEPQPFVISSSLFHKDYKPILKDYSGYIKRNIES